MVARDRQAAQGERVARRRLRGAGVRARAGPRLARLLGGAPRRAPGDGDLLDPGDQGRRRSATASRSPACPARRPTTRSSTRAERGYYRETNHAGGLEGGMTTGSPLIVRGAMKPLPTLTKPLRSVDTATHEPAQALRERTDSCTVPAAGVVGEAMVAFVLADAYRRKFGGDHIDDVLAARRRLPDERIGWHFVLIGFMGAGKSTAAARARRGARRRARSTATRCSSRAPRPSDRARVRAATARPRSARSRRSSCCELLARRRRAGDR